MGRKGLVFVNIVEKMSIFEHLQESILVEKVRMFIALVAIK